MCNLQKSRDEIQYEIVNKKLDLILKLLEKQLGLAKEYEWISEEKAKIALDVSSTTLWRLRKANKVVWTKSGKSTLYDLKSINQYLNQNIRN